MISLILLILLMTKHLICDFFLQTPYQYLNKGKYGHPGGIIHAIIHQIGLFLVLYLWTVVNSEMYGWDKSKCWHMWHILGIIVFVEGFIHYHTDWGRVQINRIMGWHANNSEWFWYLFGIDQFIHSLTYIGISYFYSC